MGLDSILFGMRDNKLMKNRNGLASAVFYLILGIRVFFEKVVILM